MHLYWPWCVKYGLIISLSSLAVFLIVLAADFVIRRRRPVIEFRAGARVPDDIYFEMDDALPDPDDIPENPDDDTDGAAETPTPECKDQTPSEHKSEN